MATQSSRLPEDFAQRLTSAASLAELQHIFSQCSIHATGGTHGATALGFPECPDELSAWLITMGADLNARDNLGCTPLHNRAASPLGNVAVLLRYGADTTARDAAGLTPLHAAALQHHYEATRALIDHGADVNAQDNFGRTPVQVLLANTRPDQVEYASAIACALLDAGATKTPDLVTLVERINAQFQAKRDSFVPEFVAVAQARLAELNHRLGIALTAPEGTHRKGSKITVVGESWQQQQRELWYLLVPQHGCSETIQGEVIRITGLAATELLDRGGTNWDEEWAKTLDAVVVIMSSGNQLPAGQLDEVRTLVSEIRTGRTAATAIYRLTQLGVAWVLLNPDPVELGTPPYRR